MSKQTKIIAIVGGVLILGVLLFLGLGKGGFKGAFGCGGAEEGKPRSSVSAEDWKVIDCVKFGFALQRDDKGIPKGKKEKDPAVNCKVVLAGKCAKDASFKKANPVACKKAAPDEDKE
jgi:hypothetical protein